LHRHKTVQILAAARTRSRKNNYQLFFYTFAPLRFTPLPKSEEGTKALEAIVSPKRNFQAVFSPQSENTAVITRKRASEAERPQSGSFFLWNGTRGFATHKAAQILAAAQTRSRKNNY